MEKIKQRLNQNSAAIVLIIQSFLCDLGNTNMIWKLESEIHKLSSTPKAGEKKRKKKKILPLL